MRWPRPAAFLPPRRARTPLQEEYFQLWRHYVFDLAMTINANLHLSPAQKIWFRRAMDGKLNRRWLGPRYAQRAEGNRIKFLAVPEYKRKGAHFHCARYIPRSITLGKKSASRSECLKCSCGRLYRQLR